MEPTNFDRGNEGHQPVEKPVESVNNYLHIRGIPQLWKPDFVNLLSKERTFWGKMAAALDFFHRRC